MKKSIFKKGLMSKKSVMVLAMVLATTGVFAQAGAGAGAAAIEGATDSIKNYVDPIGTLIQVVGAIVGIVGGVRIYNKWNNGDQDVNKELIGWGGACIFLILVPTVIKAFFGL